MFLTTQAFCEGIGELVAGCEVSRYDLLIVDELSKKVVPNFYMFSAVVKFRVVCYRDRRLVVNV